MLNAKAANFLEKLEIIITDWGSEISLSEVLNLISEAKERVKFIHIPPDIAEVEQKDSKFPEVIALNVAARRSSGEYIGRIDNDTVVGAEFFSKFAQLHKDNPTDELDIKDSFLFVERKSVPYLISRLSLPLSQINWFINTFERFFKVESATDWGTPFWDSPVGIMMFHKDIWEACMGYDEKLLYWGWMEGDLALRLKQQHSIIEFSKFVGYNFFHLEHYSNLVEYKYRNGPASPRKKNPIRKENLSYSVNDNNWGLFNYTLQSRSYDFIHNLPKSSFLLCAPKIISAIVLISNDFISSKISHLFANFISFLRIQLGRLLHLK